MQKPDAHVAAPIVGGSASEGRLCVMTKNRRAWLELLALRGATRWQRMAPKSPGTTWKAMRDAGWITAEFRTAGPGPSDHYFTITAAGRAVLAKAAT